MQVALATLDDDAKTVSDRYSSADDLPKPKPGPAMFGTEIWLKLNNTPPEWPTGSYK